MNQVNLNKWTIDVTEKDYENSKGDVSTVYMYFGGKVICVHLNADGSSSVDVNSHNCSGNYANISKETEHLCLPDTKHSVAKTFTVKKTIIESHDTKVSFSKFSNPK